jgi:hypothetical protein
MGMVTDLRSPIEDGFYPILYYAKKKIIYAKGVLAIG